MVTTAAGSLTGAVLTVGLLGVTLGVTGRVVNQSNRTLKGRRPQRARGQSKNARLRSAGVF